MPRAAANLDEARAAKTAAHRCSPSWRPVVGVGITRISHCLDNISGLPVRIEVVRSLRKQ